MDYVELLKVIVLLVAVVTGVLKLTAAWRSDRAGTITGLRLAALYMAYCVLGIGIAVALLDGPQPQDKALALTAFLLAWIMLGVLWLARAVPRTSPLPSWIGRHYGWQDGLLALSAIVGLAYYLLAD